MRELLRDRPAPDEAAAQERGWRIVGKAFAEREPAGHPRRPRPLVVALTTALALLVAGLTPPGQAVADWLRDAVKPGREDARDALVSLPARGRLIVTSQRGPWIVERDGSKRLLGAFDDASWSPRGLFVVVTRGHEVIALEPGGRPRWSLARPGRVRAARWSPDGFRIAYHAGDDLRVVAGDGTGDRPLVRGVAAAPSAWWPGPAHRLAYAEPGGRVAMVDGDSARVLWRSGRADDVIRLAWSSDGTRLLAVSPRARAAVRRRREPARPPRDGGGNDRVDRRVQAGRARVRARVEGGGGRSQPPRGRADGGRHRTAAAPPRGRGTISETSPGRRMASGCSWAGRTPTSGSSCAPAPGCGRRSSACARSGTSPASSTPAGAGARSSRPRGMVLPPGRPAEVSRLRANL